MEKEQRPTGPTYLECECSDPSHTLRIEICPEDGEIILITHLTNTGFFSRVKNAILHILGRKTIYGCFNETLLSRKQVSALKILCECAEEKMKEEDNGKDKEG